MRCMLIISKKDKDLETIEKLKCTSIKKNYTTSYGYCKFNKDNKIKVLMALESDSIRVKLVCPTNCDHGDRTCVRQCSGRLREMTKEMLKKGSAQNVKSQLILKNSSERIANRNIDYPYDLPILHKMTQELNSWLDLDNDDFYALTKLEFILEKSIQMKKIRTRTICKRLARLKLGLRLSGIRNLNSKFSHLRNLPQLYTSMQRALS